MAITVSNIEICSIPADLGYFTTIPYNTGQDVRNYFSTLGSNIYDLSGNGSFTTIFENSILAIKAKADKSAGRPSMTQIQFYDKRTSSVAREIEPNNLRWCYMALGYDETVSKAYLILTGQFYYSGSWTEDPYAVFTCGVLGATQSEVQTMYELISGSQVPVVIPTTSNGGGATHISKVTGQLKDLSSNLSDILIVSGGGGGGLLIGDTDYTGEEAGGISGSGDNSANQSIGYAFGQGENGSKTASAGGGGLYGGYKGTSSKSGGAGSGYIGNPLLTNKKMVGYKVPESTDDSTKTESSDSQSATAKVNTPKAGNGFARITFMMAKNFFPFKRWYSNVSNTFEPKIECYIEDSNHEKKSYYRKSTTGGISYDGENIKRSAYYRNPEGDPSSRYTAELCLIGDNGNLVSMNGDSEISSDEPIGHNLSEYLYYVSDYETHYNYLADIDLPIFFNYTDFKSYIQDLDDPVITSVSYNRFNKPFPKDGSTGEVTFKIQNEQTIKALMFTLIATSSSSTTRSFKVGIRTSERGADIETKTFTYSSPSSSNQMPKYYYWGGLKYSGNIWVAMYNIEDANVWTPTWLEVFTETIPEPKSYRIENLMKTRDFENDVIDIRVSGSSKTYRDITSEQIDSHKVIIAGSYDSAPTLHDNENNKLYANKVANNGNTNFTFIPITRSRIKSMLFDLTYTPRGQYSYFTITFYKITGTGNNKALEEVRTVFSTTTSQITLRNTVECNLETVDYIMIQNQGTTNASNIIYEITNFALDVI